MLHYCTEAEGIIETFIHLWHMSA